MDKTVKISGYTVVAVKYRDTDKSAILNWWFKTLEGNQIKIVGIPVYVTESQVEKIFTDAQCGVKAVKLKPSKEEERPSHFPRTRSTRGYLEAVVTFKTAASFNTAMAMQYKNGRALIGNTEKPQAVHQVWKEDIIKTYDIDTKKLAEQCTKFMEIYDQRKAKEEKANQKLADEPDEEGWITVTRTKFNKPPKAIKAHQLKKLKKKQQSQALMHFYRNQVSDSKMQKIKDLKARFEEDKKRIQEMRKQRKFKPY